MKKTTTYARKRGLMTGCTVPRIDPIAHAMAGAATLRQDQQAALFGKASHALHALQFGTFNRQQCLALVDAMNIAKALAKPPINIANDHAELFQAGLDVLVALADQRASKGTWTARIQQLDCLRAALEIYEIQLSHVCRSEWVKTIDGLYDQHWQALRGNAGKNNTVIEISN